MDYRFGPNKPNFTGTDEEWNKNKKSLGGTKKHLVILLLL